MPLLAAITASTFCTIGGTLLLVRKESMMVDGISHMVLPGMVVAFFISGSLHFTGIFWGALIAAVLGVWGVEYLGRRQNRSAVLGMIFCIWFAVGIFLLEVFVDPRVHFDVTHILFGSLESLYWLEAAEPDTFSPGRFLLAFPAEVKLLLILLVATLTLFLVFYRDLKLVCFDYNFARSTIRRAPLVYYAIPLLITIMIVASFKMTGLILILGMFVIPPLLASFFSNNLGVRVALGILFGALICLFGYALAVFAPQYFGKTEFSFNVGGTIIFVGMFFLVIIISIKEVLALARRNWQAS